MDLWDEASRDYDAEAKGRRFVAAKVAASEIWPTLAGAEDEQEYAFREGYSAHRLSELVASTLPEDVEWDVYEGVRNDVEASFRSDWKLHRRALLIDSMRKGAPFADYSDFQDCVSKNGDKDDPEAYCGKIKNETEDSKTSRLASLFVLSRRDQASFEDELRKRALPLSTDPHNLEHAHEHADKARNFDPGPIRDASDPANSAIDSSHMHDAPPSPHQQSLVERVKQKVLGPPHDPFALHGSKTAGDVPPEFLEQQKKKSDDSDSDSDSDKDSDKIPDFIQDKIDKKDSARTGGWADSLGDNLSGNDFYNTGLDNVTLGMLKSMLKALSPENQAKLKAMPLHDAVDLAWKMVNRTSPAMDQSMDSRAAKTAGEVPPQFKDQQKSDDDSDDDDDDKGDGGPGSDKWKEQQDGTNGDSNADPDNDNKAEDGSSNTDQKDDKSDSDDDDDSKPDFLKDKESAKTADKGECPKCGSGQFNSDIGYCPACHYSRNKGSSLQALLKRSQAATDHLAADPFGGSSNPFSMSGPGNSGNGPLPETPGTGAAGPGAGAGPGAPGMGGGGDPMTTGPEARPWTGDASGTAAPEQGMQQQVRDIDPFTQDQNALSPTSSLDKRQATLARITAGVLATNPGVSPEDARAIAEETLTRFPATVKD